MRQFNCSIDQVRARACAVVLSAGLFGCATIPDDTSGVLGHVVQRHYLTTVSAEGARGGPTLGVGAGGVGGVGGVGAGLGFDLTRLFGQRSETPVKVYRYDVKVTDGA